MKNITLYIILVCCLLLFACSSNNSHKQNVQNNDEKREKSVVVQKDEITITTADGKQISANYFYGQDKKNNIQPLVVLIHQFNQTKEQWAQSFIDTLVNNGYKVLAYDIRGHGKSSAVDFELTKLLSDPEQAPKDIDAVIIWARNQKSGIDSARIGAVGTSIGGNLACYAGHMRYTKTTIAISNSKEGFEAFLGIDPRKMESVFPRLASVFLICGSRDGQHEEDAKVMVRDYLFDPVELKVFDSEKHGKFLIEQYPEINTLVLNWFKKNL